MKIPRGYKARFKAASGPAAVTVTMAAHIQRKSGALRTLRVHQSLAAEGDNDYTDLPLPAGRLVALSAGASHVGYGIGMAAASISLFTGTIESWDDGITLLHGYLDRKHPINWTPGTLQTTTERDLDPITWNPTHTAGSSPQSLSLATYDALRLHTVALLVTAGSTSAARRFRLDSVTGGKYTTIGLSQSLTWASAVHLITFGRGLPSEAGTNIYHTEPLAEAPAGQTTGLMATIENAQSGDTVQFYQISATVRPLLP